MKKLETLLACLLTLLPCLGFSQTNDFMIAHYIDVGQGQAILLAFPKGNELVQHLFAEASDSLAPT